MREIKYTAMGIRVVVDHFRDLKKNSPSTTRSPKAETVWFKSTKPMEEINHFHIHQTVYCGKTKNSSHFTTQTKNLLW